MSRAGGEEVESFAQRELHGRSCAADFLAGLKHRLELAADAVTGERGRLNLLGPGEDVAHFLIGLIARSPSWSEALKVLEVLEVLEVGRFTSSTFVWLTLDSRGHTAL